MRRLLIVLVFGFLLFINFALRVVDIATIPPGIHFDEGLNILRFWRYASGYGHPMIFYEAPEPFDYIIKGGYGYFVGIYPVTMRVFSVFLTMIATAACIATARTLWRKHPQRNAIAFVAGLTIATIPAYVIIGRAIYRANWVSMGATLAFAFLARAWVKPRYYLPMGIAIGVGTIMYPGGVFVPPVLYGTAILAMLLAPQLRAGWRWLLTGMVATVVIMLPWFYLLFTVPDWLTIRLDDLAGGGLPIISDPATFFDQLGEAVSLIFLPNATGPLNYNTRTTALLNPVLAVLFAIGFATCLLHITRRRDARALAPVLICIGMLMPPALTTTPEEAIRYVGLFGVLGVLAGFGGGTVLSGLARINLNKVEIIGLLLLLSSPVYTWVHFRDHYQHWRGDDRVYFVAVREQMDFVLDSDEPLYMPLDYLNYRTALAYIRPVAYPHTRAYGGEPLPAGQIFLPFDGSYGSPVVNRPTTSYVLLLPDTGEIVILPPLPGDQTTALEDRTRAEGRPLPGVTVPELGYLLPVTTEDNPFAAVRYRAFVGAEPLAVFDDNLELMDMVAPDQVQAGEWVEVVLYWRLREEADEDYFALLQLWDTQGHSWGKQNDTFDHIFRFIGPTPMWTPGEVFAERRWLQVFPETPEGGYRVALVVHVQPGPKAQPFTHVPQIGALQNWLLGERVIVGERPTVPAGDVTLDVVFGDQIALDALTVEPPLAEAVPGQTLTVTLIWRAIAPPVENYVAFVHLVDDTGSLLSQVDAAPLDRYPTTTWQTGDRFRSTWSLDLPPATHGPYNLRVGLYVWPDLIHLPVVQDGALRDNNAAIFP